MATSLRLGRPTLPPRIKPDAPQLEAITHSGSPLLVVGGPGTGKTATLVESAVHRIENGLAPEKLLILTYGRERASLLRDEIVTRVGATVREPLARTFHSFSFSVLRQAAIREGERAPVLLSGAEQDLWIRDLLAGNQSDEIKRWPAFLTPALSTDGFVRELRDLILRASERNLSPAELAELGERHQRPEWAAAADFYAEYLATLDQRSIRTIDTSEIVVGCWDLLDRDQQLLESIRRELDVVMVDEYQESDPAQRALLKLIAPRDLLLTLDPDSAIGRFRGADPEGALASFDSYGADGKIIHLPTVYRSEKSIVDLGTQVAGRIRRTGLQRQRACPERVGEGSVEILRFKSIGHEVSYIAQAMRRAHLHDRIPYSQMAVILRTPSTLTSSLQRAFSIASVPINVDANATALAHHSAVKPLLQIAQIALEPKSATYEAVEELLYSTYGGADALDIRRLRSELRKRAAAVGDNRGFSELILDAINTPMADLNQQIAAPALRIRALIEAARKVGKRRAHGEDVLWAIWDNAIVDGQKVSALWQELAMRGGRRGVQADSDLDAVINLFESAARFSQRSPGATPIAFFADLMSQTILADTIAAKAPPGERVEILTVHSAKGREWRFVAVAGLQDGVWPNLRQRGSLLGSERLVEILSSQSKISDLEFSLGAGTALLDDERRLFHVAITRAQERLIISAVDSEDEQPSQFFNEIAEESEKPIYAQTSRGLTFTALIARLRQLAESPGEEGQEFATALLGEIARAGVRAADPTSWWGLLPLSDLRPLASPTDLVRVSPSSVDAFEKCQLRWLLERHGGTRGEIGAQAIGIALHSVVAQLGENPNLTKADLSAEIDRLWPSLDVGFGWSARRERSRVETMLEKFMDWHRANSRTLVGTEAPFEFTLERALIRGSIDRLEITSEGAFVVVDLKSGSTPLSVKDGATTAQLQLYQLAVVNGSVQNAGLDAASAGAELLYVGNTAKKATIRSQPAIDSEQVINRVKETADGMAAGEFIATENELCRNCNVRDSCPVMLDGRSVVEP
jgi:superfamily I DNA/RNA helicase/RecB family exonuclease